MFIDNEDIVCRVPGEANDVCAALCTEETYRSAIEHFRTGKGLSIRGRLYRWLGTRLEGERYVVATNIHYSHQCRNELADIRRHWETCENCPAREGLSFDDVYGDKALEYGLID